MIAVCCRSSQNQAYRLSNMALVNISHGQRKLQRMEAGSSSHNNNIQSPYQMSYNPQFYQRPALGYAAQQPYQHAPQRYADQQESPRARPVYQPPHRRTAQPNTDKKNSGSNASSLSNVAGHVVR